MEHFPSRSQMGWNVCSLINSKVALDYLVKWRLKKITLLRENTENRNLIFLRCYTWWGPGDLTTQVRFKEAFDIFTYKWNVWHGRRKSHEKNHTFTLRQSSFKKNNNWTPICNRKQLLVNSQNWWCTGYPNFPDFLRTSRR